jgi:asparagine synthase (glutamine-hydrolysing)
MGGFLYCARRPGEHRAPIDATFRASIDVHRRRGLGLSDRIEEPDFTLLVFGKALATTPGILRFESGDFIASTGTLLYRGTAGRDALRALYEDFASGADVFTALLGQFAVVIKTRGALYAFNDFNGLYHVYADPDRTVVSNSFLSVARATRDPSISAQELFEYVAGGAMLGDRTLLRDVVRLDSRMIHRLRPADAQTPKRISVRSLTGATIEEQQDVAIDALLGTFRIIQRNFGGRVCAALSGGYDTRLMLALLRATGSAPALYVYGAADSDDVRVARDICHGEGLDLQVYDKSAHPRVDPENFRATLAAQFYFVDGLGPVGAFDGGADLFTRRQRADGGTLQLNGGGGEIFRDFWQLPETPIGVEAFVRARLDLPDPSMFTDALDPNGYIEAVAGKIRSMLGITREPLDFPRAQELYWRMRLRYWMGPNNSSNNVLSPAMTPFAEPSLTMPSSELPHSVKRNGVFQAGLIRRLDPRLARYPSAYGFNFYDPRRSPGWRAAVDRLRRGASLAPWLRARIPARRPPRVPTHRRMPFYLRRDYIDRVVGRRALRIADYMRVERIRDPDALNRALTVELVLGEML